MVVMKNCEPFVSLPALAMPVLSSSASAPNHALESACTTRTQEPFLGMLELEVLVGKSVSVDALPASTIAPREVAALDHEVLDDTMEGRAFIPEALLAGSKSPEILGGLTCHLATVLFCTSIVSGPTFGTVPPYRPITILPISSSPC